MKKYIITIVIIVNTCLAFGQNWRIVNPSISTYYIDTANYISNLNISDTILSLDTTYYLNYLNYRGLTNWSFVKSSFIGDSIGILTDGINIIKSNGHTYYINTKANINDQWEFYHFPNGNYLNAKIISLDTLTVLTQQDSVKLIQIQLKDMFGNSLDTALHFIKLSKYFGIIQFPDIYYLPNGFVNIELVGRDNPKIGITNINSFDFYDFEIGDEFHFYEGYYSSSPSTINKYILTVYSKDLYNDSIVYHYLKCGQSVTNGIYSYWNNTLVKMKITLSNSNQINTVSGNYLIRLKKENLFHGRLKKSFNEPYNLYGIMNIEYSNGLGKIKENGMFPISGNTSSYQINLVYYKKGNETWGIPYNCGLLTHDSSEENILKEKPELKVYPNPSYNILHVIPFKSCEIKIQNVFGAILVKKHIQEGIEENIDISNWEDGLYIINTIGNNINSLSKFVKLTK